MKLRQRIWACWGTRFLFCGGGGGRGTGGVKGDGRLPITILSKSQPVDKLGGGMHVTFSKLKLTKSRPRTTMIYWRILMRKISLKRVCIYGSKKNGFSLDFQQLNGMYGITIA
jgi:hypothetical protein